MDLLMVDSTVDSTGGLMAGEKALMKVHQMVEMKVDKSEEKTVAAMAAQVVVLMV